MGLKCKTKGGEESRALLKKKQQQQQQQHLSVLKPSGPPSQCFSQFPKHEATGTGH